MSIFSEVELVVQTQIDGKAAVSLAPTPEKRRDLSDSEHYATGDKLKQEWARFSSFLLKKKPVDFYKMLMEMIP